MSMFADLFGSGRGRPSVPADVIATVMVLQALEGLSDRDAIAQLRMNIALEGGGRAAVARRGVPSDGVDVVAQQAARQ